MRLDELTQLACVACGRRDGLVRLTASVWPNARGCAGCVAKYGAPVLAHAADEVFAGASPAQAVRQLAVTATCRHCGGPTVLQADGTQPLVCSACEAEWRSLR